MIHLTPFTLFDKNFTSGKEGDSNIYLRKLKAQGYIILEPVSVNHKNTIRFFVFAVKRILECTTYVCYPIFYLYCA